MIRRPPRSTLFPTRRSSDLQIIVQVERCDRLAEPPQLHQPHVGPLGHTTRRSEEHTSELQSRQYLVCRLLLEKKNNEKKTRETYKLTVLKLHHTPKLLTQRH